MADVIVVMRDGIVEQTGTPLDLYDRPANMFVAGFIGSPAMNFIPGRIDADGRAFVSEDGQHLPVPQALARRAAGRAVTYGIRPEHLTLGDTGGAAQVTLDVVEPTGSDTHLMGRLGKAQVVAMLRARVGVRAGETVRLAPDPAQAHLFDTATGARID